MGVCVTSKGDFMCSLVKGEKSVAKVWSSWGRSGRWSWSRWRGWTQKRERMFHR